MAIYVDIIEILDTVHRLYFRLTSIFALHEKDYRLTFLFSNYI